MRTSLISAREQSTLWVPRFSRAFCARSGKVGDRSIKLTILRIPMWGQPPAPVRRAKLVFFALAMSCAFALTACSPRDYLTRRLATDLIATSETFNSPQQFILHTGVMSNKDYASPEYVVLLHKGW